MLELLPARPVVEPTWWVCPEYVRTDGPAVCDVAALAGFAPDAEQALLLDGMFGVAENGKSSAFEVDIFGPRQNIKTGTIVQAGLGWLYVLDDVRDIVYSAQNLDAAEECWALMVELIERTPALSKRLKPSRGEHPGITEGKGSWAIALKDDTTMVFRTRGRHTGRSLKADRVVLDEGYAVTPTHMGGLLPVLSALPDPQFVHASSAGKIESEVSKDARDRGRGGGTYRQMYAEYGDADMADGLVPCELGDRCDHSKPPNNPPGCALDDEDRWARIMPALGGRVQLDTVRGLRLSMPPEEFARECLVWWDIEGDGPPPAISMPTWLDRKRATAKPPKRACLVIDVEPNRESATIAAAGDGIGGRTLVVVHEKPGTAWVVPKVVDLLAKRDIVEVALHPQSQAGALIPALAEAGVEFVSLTSTECGQATASFQQAVKDDEVEHAGQAALDTAVANARTRFVGEVEMWDRRDPSVSISSVVSASRAAHRWIAFRAADYDLEDSYL